MAVKVGRATRRVGEVTFKQRLERFPWWLIIILLIFAAMAYQIATDPDYYDAFTFIVPGIVLTGYVTLASFAASLLVGLIAGMGRISTNAFLRNLATSYIEFVRGVPIVILLLTVGMVLVPGALNALDLPVTRIGMEERAIIALTTIYGAFVAEIFRAGIESVPHGQMEAARSLGMSHLQSMRYIMLPQAVRNMLPALGNDFIALLKDSSLIMVLAVREITQLSRLYMGSSFRAAEAFFTATMLYLAMTLVLSLFLQWYQRRLRKDA